MPTTPSRDRNLNDLEIPKFTEVQLQFFEDMVQLVIQERANLPTNHEGNELFTWQFSHLKRIQQEYEWLIYMSKAVEQAERKERIHEEVYDPQKELMELEDGEAEVLTDEQIINLL